jgi:hypothetical protein
MIRKNSRFVWCLLFFLLFACSSPLSSISADRTVIVPSTEVYFSPRGGATEAIVHELRNAKIEILVQAYSFTSTPIAKSLVDAHKEGGEGDGSLGQVAAIGKIQPCRFRCSCRHWGVILGLMNTNNLCHV